ncbi:hypothetical protein SmJEL517_g05963 [Synchytrium microbalum]|uniref:Uncharacterized protein n=1 Tax=Synchytrium microbalum TaxID=1806994 RepID=A0A507BXM0_9FUNG|nr:uncharacterized protein SmJEL517_g05963 [Synchytrium microbalum]TPX30476.1 hypothetical protein SmJEL517_g05963 [Synchytrium microbalum]
MTMNNTVSSTNIQVKERTESYLDRSIYLQVIVLDKQMICYCGDDGRLGSLSTAVKTRYSNTAAATTLLSGGVDDTSESLAKRLASKYDWQFFVSMNLPTNDTNLTVFAERKLGAFVKEIAQSSS